LNPLGSLPPSPGYIPRSGYVRQQNTDSANLLNRSNATDTIHDDGTTKTLIVNPPVGNRFYRLIK